MTYQLSTPEILAASLTPTEVMARLTTSKARAAINHRAARLAVVAFARKLATALDDTPANEAAFAKLAMLMRAESEARQILRVETAIVNQVGAKLATHPA